MDGVRYEEGKLERMLSIFRKKEDDKNRIVYSDGNNRLTLGELDTYIMRVATTISRLEEIGRPVAVMTGRHVYTPACYMGVGKAGCFYAPMDAELPEYRLNQILDLINPSYMIVDEEGRKKAESIGYGGTLLSMNELFDGDIDEGLVASRNEKITEFSPLYTIFTSGSTGKPKAVLTSYYSLFCYLDGLNKVINLGPDDVLAGQSPLDYIAGVRDMYLPLMTGARTFIVPKEYHAMPEELFSLLEKEKVTTLCWSSAGLELPARLGAFENLNVPQSIMTIVFSGSVMKGKYLKLWQERLPKARFINQYGPTETTASCTWYEVKEKANDDTVLPIGKPFNHYKVFLLDEDGKAPNPGDIGEICVSGPALALGYYGDKEQTEKVFTVNPLNDKYDERIYLTGDLGRLNQDGDLEFLGRKDRQIKFMGHRVELSEIEASAYRVEGVEECLSVFDEKKEIIKLFYTGTAEPKEIIIHFRSNMPAFMVPRKIEKLEEMPRLHNGKLDMKSLKEK